jgi:hypothetical protein
MHTGIVLQASVRTALCCAATLLMALTPTGSARADGTIGFEASVPDTVFQQDYGVGFGPYLEEGFVVSEAAPGVRFFGTNPTQDTIGNAADSGSKFIAAPGALVPNHPPAGVANAGIGFERSDAALFSVESLRVAEYSQGFAFPVTVRFVGIQESAVVEQLFSTDGLVDGPGGVPDFETVGLGPEFQNLIRFEVLGLAGAGAIEFGGFAIDDVVYTLLPEPGTAWLLALGLACAIRRSRSARSEARS